jgi:hypothetical protein
VYAGSRNRAEVARVPAAAIVEAEEPHLAGYNSVSAPRDMRKWTARAVARRNSAPRETHTVDRDPSGFDLYDVAGKCADDLADRFRTSRASSGAQIPARDAFLGNRNWQAGSYQIAPGKSVRNNAIHACRSGTAGVRNEQAKRIAGCDQKRCCHRNSDHRPDGSASPFQALRMCALSKRSHRVFCRTVPCADHDRPDEKKAASSLGKMEKMQYGTAGPLSCSTNDPPFPLHQTPPENLFPAHRKAAKKFLNTFTAVSPAVVRSDRYSVSRSNQGSRRARP